MAKTSTTFIIDSAPIGRLRLLADLWDARRKLWRLAITDFRVRYKRAFFGLLWAVALPLLQAAVLALIFSQFVRLQTGTRFGYVVFVLAGVLPWSYFGATFGSGSTAVVDNADLTEKVWFPRAMLPMTPAIANLVGLGVSMAALVVAAIGFQSFGPEILLLIPACMLLIAFSVALSLVMAALHAYFRDVRYLVAAALLVWFYATPVIYPPILLREYRDLIDFNPMTGVLDMFRLAVGQGDPTTGRAVIVTVVVTLVLLVIALEAYRRHDRLFVDTL
jgi:ABC-type polysaccharide/polyol phosphate export permease